MSGVGLTIESQDLNDLRTAVDTLQETLTSRDLLEIAGRSMRNTLREHFGELSRDSEHHRTAAQFGVTPTGFYEEAAQQTQAPVVEGDDGVSVSITKEGIAQRYFGGEIRGDPWLTIPARSEAVGHRAREFSNLRFILFRSDLAALVEKDTSAGYRSRREGFSSSEQAGGLLFYWLVRSVTQQGDPTVLPEDEEILDPAIEDVRNLIREVWDEGAKLAA